MRDHIFVGEAKTCYLLLPTLPPMAAHDSPLPSVLFVCVHNAGRSQMAAGLLAYHAAGRVEVRSAGSAPGEVVNPSAVAVMADLGIDIGGESPRKLSDEAVLEADVIITMGCGDACPIFPGKHYLDWNVSDPAGLPPEAVRSIRDEIDQRVLLLLAELLAEA
jgi:arsenate reductase